VSSLPVWAELSIIAAAVLLSPVFALPPSLAMGLCLENVPAPFQTRYVVPVSRLSSMTPGFAWLSHLPNNYADNPNTVLGKVRMTLNVLLSFAQFEREVTGERIRDKVTSPRSRIFAIASQVRGGLAAGGSRIRTIGSA
jgi:hypothetical protein